MGNKDFNKNTTHSSYNRKSNTTKTISWSQKQIFRWEHLEFKSCQRKDKAVKTWKLLDMNVFSNPFRVIRGYSIKKRNVLPLLFSVECRPHCFTHNRTLLIGFTFLLFASFSFRSPSCVQTKVILMDSCLEHPLLLFLRQQIKEVPVGLEMHEWSLQSQTFAKSSIPEGTLVCVNLFFTLMISENEYPMKV